MNYWHCVWGSHLALRLTDLILTEAELKPLPQSFWNILSYKYLLVSQETWYLVCEVGVVVERYVSGMWSGTMLLITLL